MPLGLMARLRRLERRWDPTERFIDTAIRLSVCERHGDAYLHTGQVSRVFGGVWDRRARAMVPGAEPGTVLVRPVTLEQFNYCLSPKARITGKGGRGGGKTEALAQRAECLLLDRWWDNGLLLSPDFPHTDIVADALRRRLWHWLVSENKNEHLWRTIFGTTLRFLSAEQPKRLKGWGAGWLGVDEEATVKDEAIDNTLLCLRKSADPLVFGAGTPEIGMYSERFQRLVADPDECAVFSFPSKDNCFISLRVFELAKSQMDPLRYRQEVEAEFVRLDPGAQVAKGFSRERHKIDRVRAMSLGDDVTRKYAARKLGRPCDWIAGVDYNHNYPCIAWIYKVYAPNRWVVVDRVAAADPATKLAQALIEAGYTPKRCIVVDDASGEYDVQRGKRNPNSSARLMRSLGFTCLHKSQNPPLKDRVNAFLAKINPAEGAATWGYLEEVASWVEPPMENCIWNDAGTKFDDEGGWDHDFDAATYPVVFCEPAAVLQVPRVTGVAA